VTLRPGFEIFRLPRMAAYGVLAALLLVCAFARGAETPACITESSSGARDGESLEQRIDRLETQLRLSKAERYVNRRRK
jgi:hypothetical protein